MSSDPLRGVRRVNSSGTPTSSPAEAGSELDHPSLRQAIELHRECRELEERLARTQRQRNDAVRRVRRDTSLTYAQIANALTNISPEMIAAIVKKRLRRT